MKILCKIAYWIGAGIMGLCFLPIVLVAVAIGLLSNLFSRFKNVKAGNVAS